jgi:hypothetical protein
VTADTEVSHKYMRNGTYIVRAASDRTDSATVSDSIWVQLKSTSTEFRVIHRIDPADNQLVHFSLLYPGGFLADSVYWDLGDGTVRRIHTDSTHSHKYKRADDFNVVVSQDPALSSSIIVTQLVSLKNDAKQFDVRYWLESKDSRLVHFNVSYPKGFSFDSLYWDFGDGVKKWLPADTSLTHQYNGAEVYALSVMTDPANSTSVRDTLRINLTKAISLSAIKKFNTVKVNFNSQGQYSYSSLSGWSYPTTSRWKDTVLSTGYNNQTIEIKFRSDGSVSLSERYYFSEQGDPTTGGKLFVESQSYRVRDIHCYSVSDTLVVFRVNANELLQRLEQFEYRVSWSPSGYHDWADSPGAMNYVSLEFYNR